MNTICGTVLAYWCTRCVYYTQHCVILQSGKLLQHANTAPEEWYADSHGLYRCRTYFRRDENLQ